MIKEDYIEGEGPKNATIAVVCEAPGKKVVIGETISYTGRSGKLLRSVLKENGIEGEYYLTHLAKRRPPGNDFSKILKTGKTFYDWKDILVTELNKMKRLKVVILVGAQVTNALLHRKDIMNIRGSIFMSPHLSIPTVSIIHPAFIVGQSKGSGYDMLPIMSMDVKKAITLSKEGLYIMKKRFFSTITCPSEAKSLLSKLNTGNQKVLSFDIETNPSINKILILGFATSPTKAYSINISQFSPAETAEIYHSLKEITTNPSITLIMHNAQFEMYQLHPFVGVFTCRIFDTMLAFHDCYSHFRKALKFLVSIYTNEPYYKDEGVENLDKYNCKDTTVTYEVYLKLKEVLKELNVEYLYYKITIPMIHVAVNARIKGILVDKEEHKNSISFLKDETLKLRLRLNKITPCFINPNSAPDVTWILFNHLQLESRKKSAEKDVIKEMVKKTSSPIPTLILKMKEMSKLKGFIKTQFWSNDGRCRCTWKLTGTNSGRFSMTVEHDLGD